MKIYLIALALSSLALASSTDSVKMGFKVKYEPKKAAKFRKKLKVTPKDCRHAAELKENEYIKKNCNLQKMKPKE